MIEVCEEFIYKKKKRKKSFKGFIAFFLLIVIFLYNKFFISKNVLNICSDYCYTYATSSVNTAILDVVTENKFGYEDLVKIEKNQSNDIVLISADWVRVNAISRQIVKSTEQELLTKINKGIPVPWLTFTGIGLLSGLGREINFKFVTVSSVNCNFTSNFSSSGINQTLHSIYVEVVCKLSVDYPFNNREIETSTKTLLAETVLIGKVPEIYLSDGIFSK